MLLIGVSRLLVVRLMGRLVFELCVSGGSEKLGEIGM